MGDRVSISFKNGQDESVVLFSHWDGMDLVQEAKEYIKTLKMDTKDKSRSPRDRGEPNTILLDFWLWYAKKQGLNLVDSNYYLVKDLNEGDNSDNGHHIIYINE